MLKASLDSSDSSNLRGIRLCLAFDGSAFEGWQRQAQGRTVQCVLEAAISRILGTPHVVLGSGRTDAGTHARGMIASFRTAHTMPTRQLGIALDAVLPSDLSVRSIAQVDPSFHARKDAHWKWYRYRILVASTRHPLLAHQSWRRRRVPSLAALNAAAAALCGRHDFASFANAGSTVRSTVRTLHALRWRRLALDRGDDVALPETEGHFICLDAIGDGFLYKMVRTLVGTMLAVADTPDPVGGAQAVLAARDRGVAGTAIPARGLTLMAVALRGQPAPALPDDLRSSVPAPVPARSSRHARVFEAPMSGATMSEAPATEAMSSDRSTRSKQSTQLGIPFGVSSAPRDPVSGIPQEIPKTRTTPKSRIVSKTPNPQEGSDS